MTDQPKRRGRPPKSLSRIIAEAPIPVVYGPGGIMAGITQDEAHVEALTATDAWPAGDAKPWADDPWSAVRDNAQERYNEAQRAEIAQKFRASYVIDPVPPYGLGRFRLKAGTLQQAWQHHNGVQWRPLPIVPADAPDWEDA